MKKLRTPSSWSYINRHSSPDTRGGTINGNKIRARKNGRAGKCIVSKRAMPSPMANSSATVMTVNCAVTRTEFKKSGVSNRSFW
jgi:hypothetical protein